MPTPPSRSPVHVVYGGAHPFKRDTPQKLGKIAHRSINEFRRLKFLVPAS